MTSRIRGIVEPFSHGPSLAQDLLLRDAQWVTNPPKQDHHENIYVQHVVLDGVVLQWHSHPGKRSRKWPVNSWDIPPRLDGLLYCHVGAAIEGADKKIKTEIL